MKKGRTSLLAFICSTILPFALCACSSDDTTDNNSDYGDEDMEYVDLGLSVKWATCNLGTDSPTGFGDCYAWGETSPKPYSGNYWQYTFSTDEGYATKYVFNKSTGYNGFTDNKSVLDPEDDAATVNLGDGWRMPTKNEWQELIDSCYWLWTVRDSVSGYRITGKNDNSIFLPAAGGFTVSNNNKGQSQSVEERQSTENNAGWYWSSSLYIGNYFVEESSRAYRATFYPESHPLDRHCPLSPWFCLDAFPIRPVKE